MSDARQASASSNSACSTRSSLFRPTPKEIVARDVADDRADAVLDRRERRVEADRHVAAADVEADAGDADLALVGDDAADRLGVAEMAVGADDARDHVADRHAVAHLRERRVLVLAEHRQRAVLVLGACGGSATAACLAGHVLIAGRVAEAAPCGHHAWRLASRRAHRGQVRRQPPARGRAANRRQFSSWLSLAHPLTHRPPPARLPRRGGVGRVLLLGGSRRWRDLN